MHTIVITFDLVDMTPERYTQVCAELAPSFAALPGLLTKIWLADEANARYGGVYLFDDAGSAAAFTRSALARSVAQNPHFSRLELQQFAVDEATTLATQPLLAIVPAPVAI